MVYKDFFNSNLKNINSNPSDKLSIINWLNKKNNKPVQLQKELFRDYSHIMNGQLANHEIVAYKVIKSIGAPVRTRDVGGIGLTAQAVDTYTSKGEQEIYFFPVTDAGKTNLVEFFDSQVKIAKTYYYDLHAIVMVYGTKYAYEDVNLEEVWHKRKSGTGTAYQFYANFGEQPKDLKKTSWSAITCLDGSNKCRNRTFLSKTPSKSWIKKGGGSYKYSNLEFNLKYVESYNLSANVKQEPVLGIFEVPILERTPEIVTATWPPLPLTPQVKIVPFFHDLNGVKIFLNSDVGEFIKRVETDYEREEFAEPIAGLRGDVQFQAKVRAKYSAGVADKNDFLWFNDKLPISDFEIYRIARNKFQNAPKSYKEFGEPYVKLHQSKTAGKLNQGRALPAHDVYTELLETNVKYYYMFRALANPTNLNIRSMPSEIYELQLVEQDGKIVLHTQVIEFKPETDEESSVEFRRRIKIRPALLQAAPNKNKQADGEGAPQVPGDLGFEDDSTFIYYSDPKEKGDDDHKPKFKFRITSKKTRRKMDLNIFFRKRVKDGYESVKNVMTSKNPNSSTQKEQEQIQLAKEEVIKRIKDGRIKIILGYDSPDTS